MKDRIFSARGIIGFWVGLAVFLLVLILPAPAGMPPTAKKVAAVALLMISWWITEAIPISATALLPLACFPMLGIMPARDAARPYGNQYIFLFLGGFFIATALRKWHLHKRMAFHIIKLIGHRPRQIILGFMIATAFLSMWISNTATTMIMVPIAMALVAHLTDEECDRRGRVNFGIALMLSIAYSASIGGMGTIIGTPPNLVFAGQVKILFPHIGEVGFFEWLRIGLPLVAVFIPIVWWYLAFLAFPPKSCGAIKSADVIDEALISLGKMKKEEKFVLVIFAATALGWIFRKNIEIGSFVIPGWSNLLGVEEFVHDSTVAIIAALFLFFMPVDLKKREFILHWEEACQIPWGILLLFGGGFALAEAFSLSGLAGWIGSFLTGLVHLPILIMIMGTCLLITFLTEVTSNTATATMILPVLAGVASSAGYHPFMLMLPATLSASCAFMLPIATPPNAVVFATGELSIPIMARTGLVLNVVGVILVTLLMYLVIVPLFGMVL